MHGARPFPADQPHGWRADSTSLAEVQSRIGRFLEARGWPAQHTPKNLAMSIAIEAAELMELFQWVDSAASDRWAADDARRERINEELADVMIYCFSLAYRLGLDVGEVLDKKIVSNGRKYPALADALDSGDRSSVPDAASEIAAGSDEQTSGASVDE